MLKYLGFGSDIVPSIGLVFVLLQAPYEEGYELKIQGIPGGLVTIASLD
jgi:hypothetical protein